jgi:hypothetical protein
MKINLSPTYISDSSSARRQPMPVDINLDPTSNSINSLHLNNLDKMLIYLQLV